jgi:hypothetical protein
VNIWRGDGFEHFDDLVTELAKTDDEQTLLLNPATFRRKVWKSNDETQKISIRLEKRWTKFIRTSFDWWFRFFGWSILWSLSWIAFLIKNGEDLQFSSKVETFCSVYRIC